MKRRLDRLTRRALMQNATLTPLAGTAFAGTAAAPAPRKVASIYQRLGVKTFINAYGTLTTLSGTLMPAEVVKAMEEASREFRSNPRPSGEGGQAASGTHRLRRRVRYRRGFSFLVPGNMCSNGR